MKKTILLLAIALAAATGAEAQQAQVVKRSKTPCAYKDFRDGSVEFLFGKPKTYKANVFLRDASLVYMQDGKVMKANLGSVSQVTFGNDVYRRTGDRLGKLVAENDSVALTDVITIDATKMSDDARSGVNSAFLDMPEFGVFVATDADYWGRDDAVGFPLKDEYFFIVKGQVVPANEKAVKKRVRADRKADYKELMKNRRWSWRDAKSLEVLLSYF